MRGIYQTRITKGQALTRLQDNEPVLCVKHLKGGGTVEQILNNDDFEDGRRQGVPKDAIICVFIEKDGGAK